MVQPREHGWEMTCGHLVYFRLQMTGIMLNRCSEGALTMPSSTVLCPFIHRGNRKQRYTSAAITNFKVWLNGTLIYESLSYHASINYTDFLPVTLGQGKNVLLVAVRARYNSHFGFESGTEYTVGTGIGLRFFRDATSRWRYLYRRHPRRETFSTWRGGSLISRSALPLLKLLT